MRRSHVTGLWPLYAPIWFTISASQTTICSNLLGFNHIGLSVANISLESHFYKDVMGFSRVLHNYTLEEPNTIHVVQLQNDNGVSIELINNVESTRIENITNPTDGSRYQGYFHWALTVTNLSATFNYLIRPDTGAHAVSTPAPDISGSGGRFAYVADPEGNLIELIEPRSPIIN